MIDVRNQTNNIILTNDVMKIVIIYIYIYIYTL